MKSNPLNKMWANVEFYDVFYGKNLCALFRKYISNVADGSDGATFSDTRKKSFKKQKKIL